MNMEYTPMMRQYLEVKQQYPDTIVFYRLGDFYEMFFEDAKIASAELDLVLTGRDAGVAERVPMCGFPYHAASGYIQRFIAKGYKVAIVEQTENPATAKGIVRREVIKVITPGTYVDDNDEKNCNYLASLSFDAMSFAIALVDMASGETCYSVLANHVVALEQFLLSMNVKEVLLPEQTDPSLVKRLHQLSQLRVSVFEEEAELFEYSYLLYGVEEPLVYRAFYRLLQYLNVTFKQSLAHLSPLVALDGDQELRMDYYTKRNLELSTTIRNQSKQGTLWHFLDHCKSAMGSRVLRKWIEHPLTDLNRINQRLDGVAFLMDQFLARDDIQTHLGEVYDLERLVAKMAYRNTTGRDFVRLKQTLLHAPMVLDAMQACEAYQSFVSVSTSPQLLDLIASAFVEDCPFSIKDGGMFLDGYHDELDRLRLIQKSGKTFIAQLEQKERDRTGIKNLKIGYTRVFGYYIEVSKGNLPLILPEYGYVRKQTLTNCERYVTEELKVQEDAILHAQEKVMNLEYELFLEMQDKVQPYLSELQQLATVLATIDVLQSLATTSSKFGYVRPEFGSGELRIEEGRHPILEQHLRDHRYVSNDCQLDDAVNMMIITGPNMGGKSTYMRQVGLIVIMAQMGCFVSAKKCILPVFDQIFTRIGANDDLLGGQSTFMVEMMEANHALVHATKHSLILFDEIGRGTATYDGMALAQAMIEYIVSVIHAKTLFSTHYHELTQLEQMYPQITNVHVMVHEEKENITFLYQVAQGRADRSYGINVARLAKLPESVLQRAKQILVELEVKQPVLLSEYEAPLLVRENPLTNRLVEILQGVDPMNTTPMEALGMLGRLKSLVKEYGDESN